MAAGYSFVYTVALLHLFIFFPVWLFYPLARVDGTDHDMLGGYSCSFPGKCNAGVKSHAGGVIKMIVRICHFLI